LIHLTTGVVSTTSPIDENRMISILFNSILLYLYKYTSKK
jgi:hypothetical protein